jgi:TRAP-type C4-dicarboxylate transport system substrate-binding protein
MFQQMGRSGLAIRLIHCSCPITDVNGNRGTEMPLQHEQPETILEGKALNRFRQLIGKKGGGEKKHEGE